jgi:hypothetical protein
MVCANEDHLLYVIIDGERTGVSPPGSVTRNPMVTLLSCSNPRTIVVSLAGDMTAPAEAPQTPHPTEELGYHLYVTFLV